MQPVLLEAGTAELVFCCLNLLSDDPTVWFVFLCFAFFIRTRVEVELEVLYFSDLNQKSFRVANKNTYFSLLP